jgi:predicted nucleic acid-binding Zn ribbon protein
VDDVCATCGAAVEPDQRYCLECGERLVLPQTRRRIPSWVWASLGALLIAAGGAAVAVGATRENDGQATRTVVALSPLKPAPKAARPATPRAAAAGKASSRLVAWPASGGYTIVLASLPLKRGIGPAKAIAARAVRRGFPQVGILVSTGYSGLQPGYYVVFTGVYDSIEEAQGEIPAAAARFPSAYARQIVS